MLRRNIVNALWVAVAVGALLLVFNAFLNSDNDSEKNATTKLAYYLAVDSTKQEVKETDQVATEPSGADSSQSEAPAETQTDSQTDQSQPAASEATATPAPAAGDKTGTVYTVKEGDTYGCIAEKYYGSYEHYVDIMAANPVRDYGFGEYGLFVDAQLVLPAISAGNLKPATSLCQ